MTVKNILKGVVLLTGMTLVGCDEETASVGLYPESDAITNSSAIYTFHTYSIALDSVLCNSYTSYLGDIKDPETNTHIRASFAAQFHTFENYKLPSHNLMFPFGTQVQPNEKVKCDSCEVRLYFKSYYGNGQSPMKLEVYCLDKDNVLKEETDYYSNTDLEQYVKPDEAPIATKVFTPEDYTLTDAELNSSTHSDNIRIILPAEYGSYLMNTYYEHPEYYANSYEFIRRVCPGFYFKLKSGTGTMLTVNVGSLNVYFKFYDAVEPDSVYEGISRFAATAEVIQATSFHSGDLSKLVNDPTCTYLKTPAGIGTVVELPIREIYQNHQTDSVSKASLKLTKYNGRDDSKYALGTPSTLLMVRKKDMHTFFAERRVTNSQTSYTTSFDAAYNTYTFENLSRLISYCQNEKTKGMKENGMTEAQWEAANPDWNKVVVIPVKTSSTSDQYGTNHVVSVTHDMDMNSIRLMGGPNTPLQMQVIYSRFK